MMNGRRVLLFVQHLRGIGHLQRAAAIARAMAAAGLSVEFVSGGRPVPEIDTSGVRFHQLPPVSSPDDSYTRLIDADGRDATPALKAARIKALMDIFEAVAPDAVITEMFPFGRSQIKDEMLALVKAARASAPRPLVISSIRDIIAAKKTAARYIEMADQVTAWFDAVLVHGDRSVIPFGDSFPAASRIENRIHYTGYVHDAAPALPAHLAGQVGQEVLVSAGGGAFGADIMKAATDARASAALDPTLAAAPWRLVTGPYFPEAEEAELRRRATDGVVIERMRADFSGLLANARASISLCGYNTAIEVIAAGIPAVMVPFGTGRQTEQMRRAQALSRLGWVETVPDGAINGDHLAAALNAAVAKGSAQGREAPEIDLSGAKTTSRLVGRWLTKGEVLRCEALSSPA
jgi:predicted glycosyltransferase